MKGPATWFCAFVAGPVRSDSAVGKWPMCAPNMEAAVASARESDCAFAMRARC